MEAKPYKIPHPWRKLSKELLDKIIKDIEEGSTHKYAAQSNGISETLFNMWRRQGDIDLNFNEDSLPAYLVVSLAKIKQKEVKWCRKVIKANKKGHKGAEWTLECAYWKDFGRHAEVKELAQEFDDLKNSVDEEKHNGQERKMDTENAHEEGCA